MSLKQKSKINRTFCRRIYFPAVGYYKEKNKERASYTSICRCLIPYVDVGEYV